MASALEWEWGGRAELGDRGEELQASPDNPDANQAPIALASLLPCHRLHCPAEVFPLPCPEEPPSSQGHPYQAPPWLSLSATFTLLSLSVPLAATCESSQSSNSIKLKKQKCPLPHPAWRHSGS